MKTLIVGASPNPYRYAFQAATLLKQYGHDFVALGIKNGMVAGEPIQDISTMPPIENIHTITLYIGPQLQPLYYQYLLSLKPSRIIFNPGTENQDFETMASLNKIEVLEACTLVMLRTGQY